MFFTRGMISFFVSIAACARGLNFVDKTWRWHNIHLMYGLLQCDIVYPCRSFRRYAASVLGCDYLRTWVWRHHVLLKFQNPRTDLQGVAVQEAKFWKFTGCGNPQTQIKIKKFEFILPTSNKELQAEMNAQFCASYRSIVLHNYQSCNCCFFFINIT
jgi:hypothetical protein